MSEGLRNYLNAGGSLKSALDGGKILVYSGTQPTNADDAVSGTLLCTYTKSGGAHTVEVRATGSVTLTGGAAGSVDTVTVNSIDVLGVAVPFNTSLTQTAADVAAQINRNRANLLYIASSGGAVVTLTARPGLGATVNGHAVTATLTTITASYVNIGSGVSGVSSVNGLTFEGSQLTSQAANGIMTKTASETWQGTAAATGTAGWFRFVGPVVDAGSADSVEAFMRLDGSVATSGAQLNLSSTSMTAAAIQTISTFQITVPAS